MASHIDDRWLWLGAGVFFIVAANYIKHALTDIVRLTELDPSQFPTNDRSSHPHPEENVDIKTLKTLCLSPNPSIAAAAHSLVVRRFAGQPDAIEILRRDLESPDQETHRQAKQALQYLYDFDIELRDRLGDRALDELDGDADDAGYRDEDGELQVMDVDGWHALVRARSRQQASFDDDDERGMDVVARLEQLSEEIERTERDMENLQSRVGQARFAGWDRIPAPPRSSGNEGNNRRRRHREAMVLHEGDGILEADDIIRPAQSQWP